MEWLSDYFVDFLCDWPANSPDLNPQDNLWSIMKRRLLNNDTYTLPKLEEPVLHKLWANIPLNTTNPDSIPTRWKECMPTKY